MFSGSSYQDYNSTLSNQDGRECCVTLTKPYCVTAHAHVTRSDIKSAVSASYEVYSYQRCSEEVKILLKTCT